MGTKIEMVAVSKPKINIIGKGSIKLTTRAAKNCLKKARINPGSLGVIINTGIYRDTHLIEPAIASLIQKNISKVSIPANGTSTNNNGAGTFSFDLNNGGCGLVSAMQLMDGFIQSGKIKQGMVVTGDSEPYHNLSKSYGFTSAAAAIILTTTNGGEGFARFETYTFPKFKDAFESRIDWTNWRGKNKNRNVLTVDEKDNYLDLCVQSAALSLNTFLKDAGLDLNNVDLIIPSQSPAGFPAKLKKQMGITGCFVDLNGNGRDLHTAGPAIALEHVWSDERFKQARNIIFVTVGSGITTAIALYKNKPYTQA